MPPAQKASNGSHSASPQARQEQILFGLREVFAELVGRTEPIALDDRIDEVLKRAGVWDDIDLGDVAFGLEETFGFRCSQNEWRRFFGCEYRSSEEWERGLGPQFTFRHLAEFIATRVQAVTCEPVHILGRPCLTAGAFRAVEQLVHSIRAEAVRFGPSTPIRSVLNRREQQRLWRRLRWLSEGRLPPVASRNRQSAMACVCLGALFSGVFLLISTLHSVLEMKASLLLGIIGCVFLVFVTGAWWLHPGVPKEIVTFGDLAERLAHATKIRAFEFNEGLSRRAGE